MHQDLTKFEENGEEKMTHENENVKKTAFFTQKWGIEA